MIVWLPDPLIRLIHLIRSVRLIRWSGWSAWLDPLTRRIRHYQNLWLITFFGAFYKMDSLKLFWMHLGKQTQCFENEQPFSTSSPQRHGPESPMREKPMRTLVSIKWPFPKRRGPTQRTKWGLTSQVKHVATILLRQWSKSKLLLQILLPTSYLKCTTMSPPASIIPASNQFPFDQVVSCWNFPCPSVSFLICLRSLDFSILFSNGPCSSGLDSHLMAPTHSCKVSGVHPHGGPSTLKVRSPMDFGFFKDIDSRKNPVPSSFKVVNIKP